MVNLDFDHQAFLNNVSQGPGIYQMFGKAGEILYVGKARNLKKRLASYFRRSGLSPKTEVLVSRIANIEVTVTYSETEALILEQNLIKAHRPPFNILLRDDKSYPYIHISAQTYPRLSYHRGAKTSGGRFFGPYPSAGAVRESLRLIQKVFQLRPCEDAVFNNRSRPCLQYQIKRCSAPCVDFITPQHYAEQVRRAIMFLEGKSQVLQQELAHEMEQAAQALEFERAALLRDQIAGLRVVQESQCIEGETGDLDVIAVASGSGLVCVHMLFVRDGRIQGSKSHFPKLSLELSDAEVLSAFIGQYYLAGRERQLPREVISPLLEDDAEALAAAVRQIHSRDMVFSTRVRGDRARWLDMAERAARENLQTHLVHKDQLNNRFAHLQEVLALPVRPMRLECFDISHSSGEATVASCVVFDNSGPRKSDYRRFNIEGIEPGDDYAAMEQAITRRYQRLQAGEGVMPDLLLIDGGKGQLAKAEQVLARMGVSGVRLLGVAKGVSRKPGLETLVMGGTHEEFHLPADSAALHLIQHIRDEAHRFAVTGHQQRRDKIRKTSTLEEIPGIGPKRRRGLLRHFGGLQGVTRASVEELTKVPGISEKLAEDIYTCLHKD